jgi:hypothetical protein
MILCANCYKQWFKSKEYEVFGALTTDIFLQMFLVLCIIWCKLSGVKTFFGFGRKGWKENYRLEPTKKMASRVPFQD